MATPLAHLLNGLRNEPTVRADFESSPTEFLHEHGWFELDPADCKRRCSSSPTPRPRPRPPCGSTPGGRIEDVGRAATTRSASSDHALDAIGPVTLDDDPVDLDRLDDRRPPTTTTMTEDQTTMTTAMTSDDDGSDRRR